MVQPKKKDRFSSSDSTQKKKKVSTKKKKHIHPEYGTSKLEERFAHEFLDKLGVKYQYQYKASSIKRYFDFKILPDGPLIEVDGDYYHAYGLLFEQMNPMQKHNHRVDEYKNRYCSRNGIKLIRIWEHDINNNPQKVMSMLRRELLDKGDKNNI